MLRAINAFDIKSYLLGHGVMQTFRHEWVLECPECSKDKLVVNLKKKAWHCWVCEDPTSNAGRGGLLDLIQLLDGVSRKEAIQRVLVGLHDAVSIGAISAEELRAALMEGVEELRAPAIALPDYISVDSTGIMPYGHRRGLTSGDIQQFGLVWCNAGRYTNRLIFPVWEGERLVYWQARAMWEPQPGQRHIKALNPPKQQGAAGAADVLMNLDIAKRFPRVAITEGPIDCIKAGLSAVCTFGKRLSPVQIGKLLRAGVRAVDLMWDGPSDTEPQGAWPDMFRAAAGLAGLMDVRLVFLPRGDPGDYQRGQLDRFREDARPYGMFSNLMEV